MGFVLYSMTIPIFTGMILEPNQGYLSDHPSINRYIVLGFIMSLFPMGQFFGSPILGALSDKLGRKKTICTSLILSFTFYIFVSLAMHIKSLSLLSPMLFLAGLSEGNIAIAQGAIVDTIDDHKRSRYFGYIYLTTSIGFIVGPLFASVFANPNIVSWFNFATPFWCMTILLFIVLIWTLVTFKETTAIKPETHTLFQALSSFKKVFTHKLKKTYLLNFLLYLCIFGYLRVYSIYIVDEFKVSFVMLTYFVAYVSLPFILANLFVTPILAKKYSPQKITKITSALMGLSLMVILIPNQLHALWATLFIATTFIAITMTFAASNISFAAEKTEQGSVMGNNQALQMAAEGISGFLGGVIASIWIKLPLLVFGTLALITSLAFNNSNPDENNAQS